MGHCLACSKCSKKLSYDNYHLLTLESITIKADHTQPGWEMLRAGAPSTLLYPLVAHHLVLSYKNLPMSFLH